MVTIIISSWLPLGFRLVLYLLDKPAKSSVYFFTGLADVVSTSLSQKVQAVLRNSAMFREKVVLKESSPYSY